MCVDGIMNQESGKDKKIIHTKTLLYYIILICNKQKIIKQIVKVSANYRTENSC